VLFALVGFFLSQQGILFPSGDPKTSAPATTSTRPTSASPSPSPTSASPTPTRTTATPTPTPETVNIISAAYLGKDYRQVQASLEALGLSVTVLPQQSAEAAGTVLEINPTGTVPKGTAVTIIYAVPLPTVTTAPATNSPTATASGTPLPECTAGQLPGIPATCTP
jgi:serine/threonine-protein kinase